MIKRIYWKLIVALVLFPGKLMAQGTQADGDTYGGGGTQYWSELWAGVDGEPGFFSLVCPIVSLGRWLVVAVGISMIAWWSFKSVQSGQSHWRKVAVLFLAVAFVVTPMDWYQSFIPLLRSYPGFAATTCSTAV